MRRPWAYAALAAFAALIYLLAVGNPPKGPEGATKAPPLAGPLASGGRAALSDYAGKVVLVDFWATWCDPCLEEIPGLGALHRRLSPRGFAVLGVSMDEEGGTSVKRFLAERAVPYPVILNGGGRAPAGWPSPGLPTAYLIGRDGSVLQHWFGSKDLAQVERDVETALAH